MTEFKTQTEVIFVSQARLVCFENIQEEVYSSKNIFSCLVASLGKLGSKRSIAGGMFSLFSILFYFCLVIFLFFELSWSICYFSGCLFSLSIHVKRSCAWPSPDLNSIIFYITEENVLFLKKKTIILFFFSLLLLLLQYFQITNFIIIRSEQELTELHKQIEQLQGNLQVIQLFYLFIMVVSIIIIIIIILFYANSILIFE